MKFVDRIDEAARLKDALTREKSSLVVMYGRRRLGKSTLIKRVLADNDVYFLADRSEGQHQRVLLAKVIAQVFPDFDKLTYPDWEYWHITWEPILRCLSVTDCVCMIFMSE